jgi:autotransporter translocation and assembly factor TamB
MKIRFFFILILLSMTHLLSQAQAKPTTLTGKWQISWEARIGTERDTIQLDETGSKLTGTFQGKLGDPKVSGNVDGTNISLRLDFPGAKPYSIVFTGTIDGDKMSGKFEIPGVDGAYDFHGENIRPSNYTWSAVRLPDANSASTAAQPMQSHSSSK